MANLSIPILVAVISAVASLVSALVSFAFKVVWDKKLEAARHESEKNQTEHKMGYEKRVQIAEKLGTCLNPALDDIDTILTAHFRRHNNVNVTETSTQVKIRLEMALEALSQGHYFMERLVASDIRLYIEMFFKIKEKGFTLAFSPEPDDCIAIGQADLIIAAKGLRYELDLAVREVLEQSGLDRVKYAEMKMGEEIGLPFGLFNGIMQKIS